MRTGVKLVQTQPHIMVLSFHVCQIYRRLSRFCVCIKYIKHHILICMTSPLWNRIHQQAVSKCSLMSKHGSHIEFLCCNVAFHSLVSLEMIGKVYSPSGKKICIYEVYLTCGLCKVNTTVSLCSGWVSTRFWFHSSKRETALHSPHIQFS